MAPVLVPLLVAGLLTLAAPARAQDPAAAPAADNQQRLAEWISKSAGPYTQVTSGVWETTYKGKNLEVVRLRIAAGADGIFFIAPLVPREKLSLSVALLLRIAEFNAQYDYVKLALDKASLDLRLDAPARLLDLAAFTALEGQAALAADQAYGMIRSTLLGTTP